MTLEKAIELKAAVGRLMYSDNKDARDYNALIEFIDASLRPVSRERVILCKDCQYWQGNNGGYPHPECRWGNNETPDEDDYCSFAKRLEVSKNG